VSCKPAQMESCQIIDLRLWPEADHEQCCRHVFINKIKFAGGLQLFHVAALKWL